jgi:hypothetical protein
VPPDASANTAADAAADATTDAATDAAADASACVQMHECAFGTHVHNITKWITF